MRHIYTVCVLILRSDKLVFPLIHCCVVGCSYHYTDGERPGELASVSDGDQAAGGGDIVFKVSQEVETEGEGWVDRVI